MKKIKFLTLFIIFLCFFSESNAYISDDMKGVWVATVYNLDYPSNPTTDAETLKKEADTILDNVYNMGLNAVFLQVRPSADAFYKSDIFTWSKYLTGSSGVSPSDDFDPLTYWVEGAHRRGLELHAWINPYRITKNGDAEFATISANNPAKLHPEYVVKHTDGNYYFNPGIPEVRELVINGALEIVNNYDVDGIHMDDYFYPGTNFNDADTYQKYGSGFNNIEDWRRNNVDLLVEELNIRLHSADKEISFGISPAGIWANSSKNPLGSATNGTESYYSHYADTRKWALNGWVDYIAPQIYWNIGYKAADYEVLLKWWADTLKTAPAKLYIGMADYRVVDATSSSTWYKGNEISKQLKLNDNTSKVSGEIHYRYSSLISAKGLSDILKTNYKDDTIKVFVNGNKLKFDSAPIIENSRTLVPLRAIFEALQAEVVWDGANRTVTAKRGDTQIILKIDSNEMIVNDKVKQIDVPAKIINNRTFIPLRAVSEALNENVNYYGDTRTILIEK